MNSETLMIIVQLVGNLAITIGIIIAIVQVMQMRKQRKEMAAIEFINAWQIPEFSKAVNEIHILPDRVSSEALRSGHPEMENYAFMVHSFFESTGILVNRKIISFDVVNDLVGGVIQVTCKKLELWIHEWRDSRNPVAGEWFEWLKVEIENKSKLPEIKEVAQVKGAAPDSESES